jgi:hypothetical protein
MTTLEHSQILPIVIGLDYCMGKAVGTLLANGSDEASFPTVVRLLELCQKAKAAHKQAFVAHACQELRPRLPEGEGEFRLHVLNIVETFSAPIAVTKLLTLIQEERWKLRQPALF